MENLCTSVSYGLPAKVNPIVLADTNPSRTVESLRWGEVAVLNISAWASLCAKTPSVPENRYAVLYHQLCEAKVQTDP